MSKRKYTNGGPSAKLARIMGGSSARGYGSNTATAARIVKAALRRPPGVVGRRSQNVRTGGFLGLELKFYDTSVSTPQAILASTTADNGEFDPATVDSISAPAQGDGQSNRDGNRIVLKQAHVTGIIILGATSAGATLPVPPVVYVYLVQDRQSNGAQAQSELVFVNPGASALTMGCPLRNLEYSSRFRVLKRAVIDTSLTAAVGSPTGTDVESVARHYPFHLDWKGDIPVQFGAGATAAGVAGVSDNSLHIMAFASVASTAAIVYNARVRFMG